MGSIIIIIAQVPVISIIQTIFTFSGIVFRPLILKNCLGGERQDNCGSRYSGHPH